jgi:hypothetical protein
VDDGSREPYRHPCRQKPGQRTALILPVDIALWAYALWIATERALKHLSARH